MENTLNTGDKIKFAEEKRTYTVKSVRGHLAICTKPFFKTVLYTIIDFNREIRSPNDFVFNPFDYTNQFAIDECMDSLFLPETDSTKCHLSERNKCKLRIDKIIPIT